MRTWSVCCYAGSGPMNKILTFALLLLMSISLAWAAPKKSTDGLYNCDSTGTARRDGKDDQGNKLNCLWDTCTYKVIDDKTGVIKQATDYSNPRDCHAASVRGGGGMQVPTPSGVKQLPSEPPRSTSPAPPPASSSGTAR
jgi:hypothetical protein